MNTKNTHIYVCYHKPSKLLQDEVFTPIQVGSDLTDLNLNIINDGSGISISNKNKTFCELTGIYWAWKNDIKADWIGFMHYRRFLDFNQTGAKIGINGCANFKTLDDDLIQNLGLTANRVNNLVNENDKLKAILPKKWSVKTYGYKSIREQYVKADYHFEKDLDITRDVVSLLYPEYIQAFDKSMNSDNAYFTNIFVLRRDIFNDYCDWLFKILFEVERRCDLTNYSTAARRVFGYLAERLFDIFIVHLNLLNTEKLELDRVFIQDTSSIDYQIPLNNENSVSVAIASDNTFAPHLAALIESIKESFNKDRYLDLIILDGGIKQINKNLLTRQFKKELDFPGTIRFVDCSNLYNDISTHMHFATPTFYRINLGNILINHRKVIYLDCDTIVLDDLSKLWDLELFENVIGAVPDIIMKSSVKNAVPSHSDGVSMPAKSYLQEFVGLKNNYDEYFQAGLIVFDLKKYREMNFHEAAIADLSTKKYWYLDQDILNKYLQGKVKFLDTSWNCVNVSGNVVGGLTAEWVAKVLEDMNSPKIVHYAGFEAKPWNTKSAPLSHFYWFYLRKTYWYESVMHKYTLKEILETDMRRPTLHTILRSIWHKLPLSLREYLMEYSHYYFNRVQK